MPGFPVVDTHVHLTNQQRISYSWMSESPTLNGSYGLDDFDAARGPVDVEAIVFVEVGCDVGDRQSEVEWITELAETEPRLQGIVAQLPLEQGAAVGPEVESLAGNPLVKGIRRLLQDEDLDFCLQPSFLEGLRLLPGHGLTFDLCIAHPQLANALKMVEACPEVQFVLDHIGKPGIQGRLLEPWKTQIRALAEFPNISCKMSGLTTEADLQNWTRDDLRPYIDHIIDCFGFDRVMFGSDWFVVTLASTYPRWVETLDWAVAGCSDAERRQLYVDNALSFYRLGS